MRASTITRAQAQLPATREELEQRLGLKPGSCRQVVQHMLSKGYAKEWGDKRAPIPDFDEHQPASSGLSFWRTP